MMQNHTAGVIQDELNKKNRDGQIQLPTNTIPAQPMVDTQAGIINQYANHGRDQHYQANGYH